MISPEETFPSHCRYSSSARGCCLCIDAFPVLTFSLKPACKHKHALKPTRTHTHTNAGFYISSRSRDSGSLWSLLSVHNSVCKVFSVFWLYDTGTLLESKCSKTVLSTCITIQNWIESGVLWSVVEGASLDELRRPVDADPGSAAQALEMVSDHVYVLLRTAVGLVCVWLCRTGNFTLTVCKNRRGNEGLFVKAMQADLFMVPENNISVVSHTIGS